MRAPGCLLLFTLALAAQVPQPEAEPPWLTDLLQAQQQMHEAPLGSLNQRVEGAWLAALQMPQHPQFQTAAQMAWGFYQNQGYDLKAERILRRAIAAVPEPDFPARRNLMSQLASHFESTQQLVKAAAIREQMAEQPLPPEIASQTGFEHEARALAHLYERMGEFEKAEAAWKEVARATESSRSRSRAETGVTAGAVLGYPGYGGIAPNELADFYGRRGRTEEAERLYNEALTEADPSHSLHHWIGAADSYAGYLSQQRRFDEAIELTRQIIARIEWLPDAAATYLLLGKRRYLADLYMQAGRPEEALAARREAVAEAQARGSTGPEYVQALGSLAEALLLQNRLEEAEQAVARMRQEGAASPHGQFHESMAAQILARIRDQQNRPEEASQLRASAGVPDVIAPGGPVPGRATTVFDIVGPAQQAAFQGNIEAAVAAADRGVVLAAERVPANPQEASALFSLANVLMGQQQHEAGRRLAVEALRLLDQAPDHPRVADALGSGILALVQLEMRAEATALIERQERILVAAKGTEGMAPNIPGQGRIVLLQQDANPAGVLEERQRILARTEAVTGPRSHESLYALREVAWAYPPLDNWAEEQRVLSSLLERTVHLLGRSSMDHAHLLQHMANRASQVGESGLALSWIDQAIEIARDLPDSHMHLPGMEENRAQLQAKDAPPAGPFHGHGGAAAGGGLRWFDAESFQATDGVRLSVSPADRVPVEPAVPRDRVSTPAKAGP